MTPLGPKDPEELKIIHFPFGGELESGETLSVLVISCAIQSGVDAAAAAMPSGAPIVVGSDVYQRVQAGVDGASYLIRCKATSSTGLVHVLAALLDVKTAGP